MNLETVFLNLLERTIAGKGSLCNFQSVLESTIFLETRKIAGKHSIFEHMFEKQSSSSERVGKHVFFGEREKSLENDAFLG